MVDKKIDKDIERLSIYRDLGGNGNYELASLVVESGTLSQFIKYIEIWHIRKDHLYYIVENRDDLCRYMITLPSSEVAYSWEYDYYLIRILSCRGMTFSPYYMNVIDRSLDFQLQEIEPFFPFFTFNVVIRGYLDYLEYLF